MADETKQKQDEAPKASADNAGKGKSKLKEVPKPDEGTVVNLARKDENGGRTTNYIWVEGTGESKHMPKGKKYEVQELHGRRLIEKGAAKETTAPAKPKPAAKKAKDEDEEDD